MTSLFQRGLRFLRYRFVDAPRGFGKPVPPAAFDAEYRSGHWDEFYGTDEAPRYDRLVTLIHRLHPHPRVLDVGCGSGRLAQLLNPIALSSYLGIDLSPTGLTHARGLGLTHARFELADFNTWQPPAPSDLIVFNESMGYARDPAALLVSFVPYLAPGGSLVVSYYRAGNHAAIWRRIERRFSIEHREVVTGGRGLEWDLKQLKLRSLSA